MTVKVSGADLSMTATGAAHLAEGQVCTHLIKTKTAGDLRLAEIPARLGEFVPFDTELVLIEGYLNHSHSAGITGMVHGAVRLDLQQRGIKYATLPPSSLKKFATGRGGASKTDMALAAFKRAGAEFTNDNECDAWWLYQAAATYLGAPMFDLPKNQLEALDKINMEV